MAKIPFLVSARTARLIGRENVANAEGALIELVKNCYDADSKIALILIDKINDQIIIMDAGDGMTDTIITEQWMTIGTDDKLTNAITANGRIKSGAKGIGRFALDRLGESCTMITFAKGKESGFIWNVNWGDFEKKIKGRNINIGNVFATLNPVKDSSYLEQISANVNCADFLKKLMELDNSYTDPNEKIKNGTTLIIKGLRDSWGDNYVNRVFQTLELLNPPEGSNKIDIWLISSEDQKKYGKVDNEEFTDYDYKLKASYIKDPKKNPDYNVTLAIHRNEFDFNLIDKRLFDHEEMKIFPFDKETFQEENFTVNRKFSEL